MSVKFWSFLAAVGVGVAISVTVMTAREPSKDAGRTPSDAQVVHDFMALGGTTTPRLHAKNAPEAEADCVPCRENAEVAAKDRVPSRPPSRIIDNPYQQITGRGKDFTLPRDDGIVAVQKVLPSTGWVVVATGMPYQQLRCFVQIHGETCVVSHISGALSGENITLSLREPAPAGLSVFGAPLLRGVHIIGDLTNAIAGRHATGSTIGTYQVASASPGQLVFTRSGFVWSQTDQDDVVARINAAGRVVHWTHVRATEAQNQMQATRFVWIPDESAAK